MGECTANREVSEITSRHVFRVLFENVKLKSYKVCYVRLKHSVD